MMRPASPDQARLNAIHAADASLDRAVRDKRALLLEGSLTSDGYCAECWKIITVRKEAARRIERDHPLAAIEVEL